MARRKFAKTEKYSLGESIETSTMDILMQIVDAGQQKREWKIPALDTALRSLEKTKILLRLASEMGQIQGRPYLAMQERIQKIGRMLGGWRKSI